MQEQNEFQPSFADPTQPMEAEERTFYRNSTRVLPISSVSPNECLKTNMSRRS